MLKIQQTRLIQSLMVLHDVRTHHVAEALGCSMGRASQVVRGISPCSKEEVLVLSKLLNTPPEFLPITLRGGRS